MTTMITGKELTGRIGERLRAERARHKLSLSALSERTGGALSKSRISNYEQGIRRMGLESAVCIAEALGDVTPDYLLCLEDAGPLSPDERALVINYRLTDERGRTTLLTFSQAQIDVSRESENESESETAMG
jgi:transcriptional regulator with XRE-family HTH domain